MITARHCNLTPQQAFRASGVLYARPGPLGARKIQGILQ